MARQPHRRLQQVIILGKFNNFIQRGIDKRNNPVELQLGDCGSVATNGLIHLDENLGIEREIEVDT